jgi:hypothetical protein
MTLLSACSTTASVGTGWLRPPDPPEILYQGVSGADFATTVSIARQSRCYREVGFPTAQIIGSHPSVGAVEGWWAVQATSHYMISQWLDREIEATDSQWWRGTRVAWQTLTLGYSSYNVAHNISIGLRPFSSGDCTNGWSEPPIVHPPAPGRP